MYQFILLRSYAHVTKINEVIDECNSPNEIRHRRKYEIAVAVQSCPWVPVEFMA